MSAACKFKFCPEADQCGRGECRHPLVIDRATREPATTPVSSLTDEAASLTDEAASLLLAAWDSGVRLPDDLRAYVEALRNSTLGLAPGEVMKVTAIEARVRSLEPQVTDTKILELALDNAYKLLDDIAEDTLTNHNKLRIRKMLPKRFTNSFEHDN